MYTAYVHKPFCGMHIVGEGCGVGCRRLLSVHIHVLAAAILVQREGTRSTYMYNSWCCTYIFRQVNKHLYCNL